MRRIIAVINLSDPFAALDRFKARLDTLTTERIAEHLQVTSEYVEQTFTRRDMLYAAMNSKDPLNFLKRVKHNLELLSAESVSEVLGLVVEEAKRAKHPNRARLHFAIHTVTDPLDALRKHIEKR